LDTLLNETLLYETVSGQERATLLSRLEQLEYEIKCMREAGGFVCLCEEIERELKVELARAQVLLSEQLSKAAAALQERESLRIQLEDLAGEFKCARLEWSQEAKGLQARVAESESRERDTNEKLAIASSALVILQALTGVDARTSCRM
jgi:hypothetical protein